MCFASLDSQTPNGCRPLGAARSHAAPSVEPGHDVSRTDLERLANDFSSLNGFVDEIPIRFNDHRDGFLKIRARLLESGALSVRTRQLLDEADVPLWHFLEYRR